MCKGSLAFLTPSISQGIGFVNEAEATSCANPSSRKQEKRHPPKGVLFLENNPCPFFEIRGSFVIITVCKVI